MTLVGTSRYADVAMTQQSGRQVKQSLDERKDASNNQAKKPKRETEKPDNGENDQGEHSHGPA